VDVDAAADAATAPPRPRRGLLRGALALAGAVGDAADAALVLGTAEAELTRAALPYIAVWAGLTLLFAISVVACLWTAALLGLLHLTGSLGVALALMAALSLIFLLSSLVLLRRLLHWASFPESRRRLMALLHRLGYGKHADAGQRTS
jgi:hypothetical protein